MSRHRMASPRLRQSGFTLIELLVALLVFALGVVGLLGLQGSAIRFSTDAQLRAEATFLADQLLGQLLISDPATFATVAHHATGNAKCAPTGAASTNAVVTAWLSELSNRLPKASENLQQIVVNAATGQVTVKLCWQNGNGTAHELQVSNQVQWQP
ncbi:MAG: type IV pilus modification protein PilV [Burkholderiaceae bacterium]|nr:type IV pilus modification protein PilV [Burkholderiaceae bacterium]